MTAECKREWTSKLTGLRAALASMDDRARFSGETFNRAFAGEMLTLVGRWQDRLDRELISESAAVTLPGHQWTATNQRKT